MNATPESNYCDVLVVGLGPVGTLFAGLLRTQGLSVIAIDREADIYPLPRAGAFDGEAMRVFQMIGIADALRAECRVLEGYKFLSTAGETLMEFEPPPGPGPTGWDMNYVFHQPDVERTLRARIAELGADIRLRTRLTRFAQQQEGATARVDGPDGPYTIAAGYIVGCDGANSAVRDGIPTGVFDYGFSESWQVIDGLMDDADDLPQICIQICNPAQPTTFARMTGTRYRWEFMIKPGDDPVRFGSDENLSRLLAPWNATNRIKIERRAQYRFRGLVANQWRSRRILLAGDAAHLMPPFLGQGMCSGIRDACNLAWKLAAVIHGEAGDALLDTYQQEREPHVRAIIEKATELGKAICVLDPERAARRDAGMLAMRAAGQTPPMMALPPLRGGCFMGGPDSGELFIQPVAAAKHMDDAFGRGAWLITRKPSARTLESLNQFTVGALEPAAFRAPLTAWLDQRGADAVLVRPDRHVFGVGDPDELIPAWEKKLTQGVA